MKKDKIGFLIFHIFFIAFVLFFEKCSYFSEWGAGDEIFGMSAYGCLYLYVFYGENLFGVAKFVYDFFVYAVFV